MVKKARIIINTMTEQKYRDFLILYPILSDAILNNKVDIGYLHNFNSKAKAFIKKSDGEAIDSKINILDVMQYALALGCPSLAKCEGVNDTLSFIRELGSVEANELTQFHKFISHKGYGGEYMNTLKNLDKLKQRRTENDGTSK